MFARNPHRMTSWLPVRYAWGLIWMSNIDIEVNRPIYTVCAVDFYGYHFPLTVCCLIMVAFYWGFQFTWPVRKSSVDMEVSKSWGTPSSHPFERDFPWTKLSSYWGIPTTMATSTLHHHTRPTGRASVCCETQTLRSCCAAPGTAWTKWLRLSFAAKGHMKLGF